VTAGSGNVHPFRTGGKDDARGGAVEVSGQVAGG
jgi:hypothetical protein